MKNVFYQWKIMFVCVAITILYFFYSNQFLIHTRKIERYLKIDRRKALTEDIFVQKVVREIPYLPIEDLSAANNANRNLNASCAWYPSLGDVKIHNDYWQQFQNGNLSYFIFGAYLDNRSTVVKDEPVVRVLANINFLGKSYDEYPLTYCQFWYKQQSQPIIVPMKEMHKLWIYEWGNSPVFHFAHFINCPLPKEHKNWIPSTVSLVEKPCDKATNNVRVTYQPLFPNEKKEEFAVCMKGLDFPGIDMSHRIVEFAETVRALGAKKITTYHMQVHPNITKVLNYYINTGYLENRRLSMSKDVSSLPNFRHVNMRKNQWATVIQELIPYNDCLYRNMYRYKYVAIIDIDELIMPLANLSTWHDLVVFGENLKSINCNKFASFCFYCVYFRPYTEKGRFTTDIPEYFHMMQHVERETEHAQYGYYTKCLHNTDYVIASHNHFPMHVAPDICHHHMFSPNVSQLNHYRAANSGVNSNNTVMDFHLWRFKNEIITRSMRVFDEIGFFDDD